MEAPRFARQHVAADVKLEHIRCEELLCRHLHLPLQLLDALRRARWRGDRGLSSAGEAARACSVAARTSECGGDAGVTRPAAPQSGARTSGRLSLPLSSACGGGLPWGSRRRSSLRTSSWAWKCRARPRRPPRPPPSSPPSPSSSAAAFPPPPLPQQQVPAPEFGSGGDWPSGVEQGRACATHLLLDHDVDQLGDFLFRALERTVVKLAHLLELLPYHLGGELVNAVLLQNLPNVLLPTATNARRRGPGSSAVVGTGARGPSSRCRPRPWLLFVGRESLVGSGTAVT